MAQHDYNIANQTFPNTRSDINNALSAIASNNSGTDAPSTTFANQWFYETDTNKLFIRNEDNDAYIHVLTLDQTNDTVSSVQGASTLAGIDDQSSSNDDQLTITDTTVVVNEDSDDVDFRVESNGQTHAIFVDAGNDHVNINTSSDLGGAFNVSGNTVIQSADNTDTLRLVSTDDDANVGPVLVLHRNSASPADNDVLGNLIFAGEDSAGNETDYLRIDVQASDKTNGAEDGQFRIMGMIAGSEEEFVRLNPSGFVFNEGSLNLNFRIESNGDANMFFVDGGNDRVGIGTNSPGRTLSVGDDGILGLEGSSNAVTFTDSSTLRALITSASFGPHNGDGLGISTQTGEPIKFFTNESEAFRLESDGKPSFGFAGSSGSIYAFFRDSGNVEIIHADATNASYAEDVVTFDCNRAATSSYNLLRGTSGGQADSEIICDGAGRLAVDGAMVPNGADYAEYFEWSDGNTSNEDRVGYSVVLDGNKIVKATDSDDISSIIGVISGKPAIVGDSAWNKWQLKHLKDDYGRYIYEDYTQTEWTDNDGNIVTYQTDLIPANVSVPDDAIVTSKDEDGNNLQRRKVNPDWNEDKVYIPRSDRKEWDTVGLVGKLKLKKGQPTGSNWIKMRDISDNVEEWLVR